LESQADGTKAVALPDTPLTVEHVRVLRETIKTT
jgi:hypothetical protein